MPIDLFYTNEDIDSDTETDIRIELETLPRSVRRRSPHNSQQSNRGITTKQLYAKNMSSPRKPGLKERLFGTRKNGKGVTKFDFVRNSEVTGYSQDGVRNSPNFEIRARKNSNHSPSSKRTIHGHLMESHKKSTWCDICEEFVWGLYAQAVRCQYCKYTCHTRCTPFINLDCPKQPTVEKTREDITRETLEILSETDGNDRGKINNNLPDFVSSLNELQRIINNYNSRNTLIMTLHHDCTFDGFIRVQMNLNRPVNVSADTSNLTLKRAVLRTKSGRSRRSLSDSRRPLSELWETNKETTSEGEDSGIESQSASSTLSSNDSSAKLGFNRQRPARRLSFYLPKGTYKPLHVTSTTTAKEVIEALLSKYSVTDNPKKYALFEKTERKTEGKPKEYIYRKLQSEDKPLVLLLSWELQNQKKSFALKEDEDGLIQWMNFELPELNNFMKILQLEEDEFLAQIYQKYEQYKDNIQRAIDHKNETEGLSSSEC